MNVWKMIVLGIGMLALLLSPLQRTAQAQREGSDKSSGQHQISKKTHRGAHPKSRHKGERGRIERNGKSHGKIAHHRGNHGYHHVGRSHARIVHDRGRHGYHRVGRSHGYYKGYRHYTPSRHWKYYRHAGGGYAFDGRQWYFHQNGRWYHHIQPRWYGGCQGTLLPNPLFPWTYSFAFPGYYDCP
jgi:hypothetical protein